MRPQILLMLLVLTNISFADGGAWSRQPDGWNLHPESQQYALIDYNDGYERLGLTVDFGVTSDSTNAIWVVPIPSNPTKADIKLIDGFPIPYGSSISEQARNSLNGAFLAAAGWGTFPLNIMLLPLFIMGSVSSGLSSNEKAMVGSSYYDGISIFQRVSLGGVTSDLVATKDPAELESYLSSKGVELAGEYKMILEKYVDKDYSFVVTYISDWQKFQSSKTNRVGGAYPDHYYGNRAAYPYIDSTPISLRIGFPSEKPFFPLKLTSIYGDQVIPITIYMMGNYKPNAYPGLVGVKADYFRKGYMNNYYRANQAPQNVEEFFRPGRSLSNLDYTKITINEKSIDFNDDLWFDAGLPASFTLKKAIADNFLVLLVLIMAIICSLSGIFAGRLAFKESGLDDTHFGLYGLYGLTTMIGFIIATWLMKTTLLDEKTRKALEGKGFQVFDNRKIAYIVLYYVLFVALLIALWAVAGLMLG